MLTAAILLASVVFLVSITARHGWSDPTWQPRNDLIFEERNKAYGAYALRRDHDRQLALVLLIMVAALGAAMIGLRSWVHAMPPVAAPGDHGTMITVVLNDDPFLPPRGNQDPEQVVTPPVTKPKPKPKQDDDPIVEAGETDADTIIKHDDAADPVRATDGASDGDGSDTGGRSGGMAGDGVGSGLAGAGLDTDTVLDGYMVETLPVFPGGETAMAKWIDRNLWVPETTRGKEQVLIQFVVERDGRVSNVKGVKGRDRALLREGERAVRRMPPWEPAKMGEYPVRCRLVLPIRVESR